MVRIKIIGDPILRMKAKPVRIFDSSLRNLIQTMIDVMLQNGGVGLAAPQVGVGVRLFVFDEYGGAEPRAIVNPEMVEHSDDRVIGEEGCLSIPNVYAEVERYRWVKLKYRNEWGEEKEEVFEDYVARIVQHEFDHLDGVLFIDRLTEEERRILKPALLEISKQHRGVRSWNRI